MDLGLAGAATVVSGGSKGMGRAAAVSLASEGARVALKREMNARYGPIDKITFDESVNGEEVVEGFHAFVEKRDPAWVPDEYRRR